MNSDYMLNLPNFLFQVKGVAFSELANWVLVGIKLPPKFSYTPINLKNSLRYSE
jgi:hypothetical protein